MTLPIFALALAAFGIGTTEFVIMGLLQDLSTDLSVSTAQAGLLVSGYALGVVIGGPIFTVASFRWPRRLTLLTLVGIFIAGNLACALSPTYNTLMGSRILTSLAHGAFFGIGSVTAANIAPPGQRGKAIAAVFSGLTIASVLGVPIGTAIGQYFGWRATF